MENNDKICSNCCKADVCIYKGEIAQFAKEVSILENKLPISVTTDIKCTKFLNIKNSVAVRSPQFKPPTAYN